MAYNFNKLIPHVNFGNNTASNHNQYVGSCVFSGSNYFKSGYDYVGLQLGDDNKKWQLVAIDSLKYRRNNSGGNNSSNWGEWITILDSSNYSNYVSGLSSEPYQDRKIYTFNFPYIDITSYPQSEYNFIANRLYKINLNNLSEIIISLIDKNDYDYFQSYNNYNDTFIYNSMHYKIIFDTPSTLSTNTNIKITTTVNWQNWPESTNDPDYLVIRQNNAHYEIDIEYNRIDNVYYGIFRVWNLN